MLVRARQFDQFVYGQHIVFRKQESGNILLRDLHSCDVYVILILHLHNKYKNAKQFDQC